MPDQRKPRKSSKKTAKSESLPQTEAVEVQAAAVEAKPVFSVLAPPTDPAAFLNHVLMLTNRRFEVRSLASAELARLEPTKQIGTQSPTAIRQEADLKGLKTWHEVASTRLAELRSGRTGSNSESQAIPDSLQPEAAKLMRRLVVGLSKNAGRISTLEGRRRRWDEAVKAVRESIQLRAETAKEILGAPLRPDARLHLKLAHAMFMLEGNTPQVRAELKDAAARMPKSKGLPYWLARYEIMAGNAAAAAEAAATTNGYFPVRQILTPLLEPETTRAPWLSWPCNFYTYRYTLAKDDELRGMQQVLAALSNNPQLEATFRDVFHIPQTAIQALKDRAVNSARVLSSLILWNQANLDLARSKYASAARNYEECQRGIVAYFAARHPSLNITLPAPPDESGSDPAPGHQLDAALEKIATALIRFVPGTIEIFSFFRRRNMTMTLDELQDNDWRRPKVVPLAYEFAMPLPMYGDSTDFVTALVRLLTQASILISLQTSGEKVEEKIDAPLLGIALVFCPIAIAEANRLRRHFDKALTQCTELLRRHATLGILSEVVEKPFVKILKAQILMDKADAQYKARALAANPARNPDGSLKYQGLEAAETYQGVLVNFQDQGQYVNRVNTGLASMTSQLQGLLQHTFHPIAVKAAVGPSLPPLTPADRQAFDLVGKKVTIETITPRQGTYPEPDRSIGPHQSLLKIALPSGGALLETNPVIYALLVQTRARLLQMESGLNYLGYSDSYVPPWRFQFLLDRARYFAEHSKNAQREYLNFLSNAEREEFQELTAAQNVEMEKSNIRTETARVEQVSAELEAAKESVELANMAAAHAQQRFANYMVFDDYADSLFGTDTPDPLEALSSLANIIPGVNPVFTAIGDIFTGGAISNRKQVLVADAQREVEKKNLELAIAESAQAAVVAQRQLAVARGGLLVAGMQRAAAVLRHEFALQNLVFLRNRTLNAELWYRLSAAIRDVADTYLRYGIEMAFLAEQAYEFEADKRLDVIRFDYDVSDLGDMLAGDFLLRDLDTLEQDLIVGQKLRQQQVRYVLSLAREFPEALQELRLNGAMTFTMRLEQLERRFPGLFNLRISSVDVMPLALMDSSRFSLQLTHLGSGQVRLHAEANPSGGVLGTDWLSGVAADWSIRLRTTPPETAVFSGLTRQEIAASNSFFAANQLGAFEGLAAASSWQVDLSMKENRIVPGTLADLLIIFTLSGYYDSNLREAVDHAPRKALATTTWFSGHQQLPDAFYQFNQTGRMDWQITSDFLALRGSVGRLRNVAVLCIPSQKRAELGRLSCSYPIEFQVSATGAITILQELPQFTLSTNGLLLNATLNTPAGSTVTFVFGDGTGLLASTALPHAYARPGRYEVLVRIAANGRLTEYRAAVVVSRQHAVQPPCIARPVLQTTVSAGKIKLTPSLQPSGEVLAQTWRIDNKQPDAGSDPVSFTLTPGRYVLRLLAMRPLSARFYSQQRFNPASPLSMNGLRLVTNRTFNLDTGAETTTNLNAFGQHLFAQGPLAPTDRWTLELPLSDNPAAVSVTSADVKQHDLSELSDAVLALEYEIGDV
jgi:hypothetical protein